MPEVSENLVSVKHLRKRFIASRNLLGKPTKVVSAVNDVSFDIRAGETFSIVGESGCGKSTTCRLINHLIAPDAGEVWFEGREISRLSEKQVRSLRCDMQVVFQDPNGSLNPRMKIQEIIGEPLLIHTHLSSRERLKRVQELLEAVGLSAARGESYPHELSCGQRQRVGIARALSVNPKLVIADEPVAALDVSIRAQVLNLLCDLQERFSLTYLFISHDLAVVEMISDRIAVMHLGSIVECAPNEELYRNPRHPYTQALLSAVPIPDPAIRKEHVLLAGDMPVPTDLPSGCLFRTRCPHATERCADQPPTDQIVGEQHTVRCHYPELEL